MLLIVSPLSAARSARDSVPLRRLADSYVAALVAHDPARMPAAGSIRATQNGSPAALGTGLWQGAGAIGLRRDAYDPAAGGIAMQLGLTDNGNPAIALIRLHVSNGKIDEQEIVLAEKGRLAPRIWSDFDAFAAERQPQWAASPPRRARDTRTRLLAIARTYFDGLAAAGTPGFAVPAFSGTGCDRYENGVQVTNMPFQGRPPASCIAQFAAMGALPAGTFRIVGARYPVIDVEHGIVAGFAVLFSANQPGGVLFGELYKIEGSKITSVQIVDDVTRATDRGTGW